MRFVKLASVIAALTLCLSTASVQAELVRYTLKGSLNTVSDDFGLFTSYFGDNPQFEATLTYDNAAPPVGSVGGTAFYGISESAGNPALSIVIKGLQDFAVTSTANTFGNVLNLASVDRVSFGTTNPLINGAATPMLLPGGILLTSTANVIFNNTTDGMLTGTGLPSDLKTLNYDTATVNFTAFILGLDGLERSQFSGAITEITGGPLAAVPEPATLTLWGICGLAGAAVVWRNRRKAQLAA